MIDHLSGDVYKPEGSPRIVEPPSTSSPFYTRQPLFDEPPPRSMPTNPLLTTPRDAQSPSGLPPPPSRYNQRQQYFEQQKAGTGGSQPHLSNDYSSYDNMVGNTKNLSLSPTPTRSAEHEEALFKDLVDFAKAKSSSSKSNRPFWEPSSEVWPCFLFLFFFFVIVVVLGRWSWGSLTSLYIYESFIL